MNSNLFKQLLPSFLILVYMISSFLKICLFSWKVKWQRDSEAERSSVFWLTAQMATMASVGPGQRLGVLNSISHFYTHGRGPKSLCHLLLLSLVLYQGAGLEAELPGLDLAL